MQTTLIFIQQLYRLHNGDRRVCVEGGGKVVGPQHKLGSSEDVSPISREKRVAFEVEVWEQLEGQGSGFVGEENTDRGEGVEQQAS